MDREGGVDRDDGKPEWWVANELDRASLDLPAYEPPRFADGAFVHEVVGSLEAELDCEIRLIGVNVDWGDAWEVRVDGETAFSVDRDRDDGGNTHYRIDSGEFERRVREHVE